MLIGVLIIVIVRLVLFLAQDEKATQNQVRYPKAYLCVGIVSLLFWCFFITLILINDIQIYKSIFSLFVVFGFTFLSIYIIQSYFNIRLIYNDDFFIYSNFFGKKYIIKYDEIVRVYRRKTRKYMVVYETTKKNIVIDSEHMIGYGTFVKYVNKARASKNRYNKK